MATESLLNHSEPLIGLSAVSSIFETDTETDLERPERVRVVSRKLQDGVEAQLRAKKKNFLCRGKPSR